MLDLMGNSGYDHLLALKYLYVLFKHVSAAELII